MGKARFVTAIQSTFSDEKITNEKLSDMSVSILPNIFGQSTVIITNFDHVLENIFSDKAKFKNTFSPYDSSEVIKGDFVMGLEHYLLKFHGDYLHTDKIVLTKEQYNL